MEPGLSGVSLNPTAAVRRPWAFARDPPSRASVGPALWPPPEGNAAQNCLLGS